MRAKIEADGWTFLEHVGVPTKESEFMASISTYELSMDASVTAIGIDGNNRTERKYSSGTELYLVAGFQSPETGSSFAMVFKRPRSTDEKWWSIWMTAGKTPVQEFVLGPDEQKTLVVSGTNETYVGILVNEALAIKRASEESGRENSSVYLTQNTTGKYVGTYHSASVAFDLSLGQEFTIKNRSPIRSEVLIYRDSGQ